MILLLLLIGALLRGIQCQTQNNINLFFQKLSRFKEIEDCQPINLQGGSDIHVVVFITTTFLDRYHAHIIALTWYCHLHRHKLHIVDPVPLLEEFGKIECGFHTTITCSKSMLMGGNMSLLLHI
jgi:hypothetical protein